MSEYRRPGQFEDLKGLKKADRILWSLLCDVEYYLGETDSKNIVPPKHALDMMFKYIHRELHDAHLLICDEMEKGKGED